MIVVYFILLFLLVYVSFDYWLRKKKKKDTPKIFRLFFYLFVFVAYLHWIGLLDTSLFTTTYFGVPNIYWFYFISFIGVFLITFTLDVIFISQKNIIEITTSGIKFSEKDQELLINQHYYLEMFEELLAIENDMIQNTCKYMKIQDYQLLDALLLSLNNENPPIEYDELQLLRHYLSHFFSQKDSTTGPRAVVKTYAKDKLDQVASLHHLRPRETGKLQNALDTYGPARRAEGEDIYNIDENNILFKKYKKRYVVIFCYYYQQIGKNILVTIDSPVEILRAELYMISNILMSFERQYFNVCDRAIDAYYRGHPNHESP